MTSRAFVSVERRFETLEREEEPRDDWQPVLRDLPIPSKGEYIGPREECVYFVQEGDDGPVKIGTAGLRNVMSRVGGLQTGNPRKLHLRRVVRGGAGLEVTLQRRYAAHRIRGEWFEPHPELLEIAIRPVGKWLVRDAAPTDPEFPEAA